MSRIPEHSFFQRLHRCWQAFRAWRQSNLRKHDAAESAPCCAKPPPGAGKPRR